MENSTLYAKLFINLSFLFLSLYPAHKQQQKYHHRRHHHFAKKNMMLTRDYASNNLFAYNPVIVVEIVCVSV